jgi:hypothetical protein
MRMHDETMPIRARWARAAKAVITPAEAAELRELYAELPDASAAAAEALGNSGAAPTGLALERFRELDGRVLTIIDRIKAILG